MGAKSKIIGVHLLNDFSGSPLVFSHALDALQKSGEAVHLISSKSEGFLSGKTYTYHHVNYVFKQNIVLRLVAFAWAQLSLFIKVFLIANANDTVYINTLLPAGAAIAAKLKGAKVIYHVHETSLGKYMKILLKTIANNFGNKAIYVSRFLLEKEGLSKLENRVVYNALSAEFMQKAETKRAIKKSVFRVLMLCSLKAYKGVGEFVELAKKVPNCAFDLVLNAQQNDIDSYFNGKALPNNLTIYPVQKNVHPFYAKASLLLNLSRPDEWVETFGMTILEGFAYGLPCIAPPVGGPAEIVEDGKNGFTISSYNTATLIEAISLLSADKETYKAFSEASLKRVDDFKASAFEAGVLGVLKGAESSSVLNLT